jgi:DNA-directed RNA polymerase subunit RPC12/RpoP
MPETFKCPACSAPLEFEGKMIQKCGHCGSNVIVPSHVMRHSPSFGGAGVLDFGDLSALTGKARNLAEIQGLIKSGRKIEAIKVFRETFGTSLKDAKDAVDALERGESIDLTAMRVQTSAGVRPATSFQISPQTFDVVKKATYAAGGSILLTSIISALVIIGTIGMILYFTLSSVDEAVEKKTLTPAKPKAGDSDSKVVEALKFGGEGNGAGRFTDNRVVAVDGQGRIYSSDYKGGKIQVFDANGKLINQWVIDPEMLVFALVANRKGTLYAANYKSILAFEGESGRLLHRTEARFPRGLALMPDGKVVATVNRGFAIFDAELNKIKEIEDANDRASVSFGFEKVAVDGDSIIHLIPQTEKMVCKFSSDGKFLDRFKLEDRPNDIAIDNRGRIFLSHTNKINVHDAEGSLIESFQTTQAFGMAFNDDGELLVASRPFVVKYQLNF